MNFIRKKALSRRHFLKGAGYSIALPFLDAMMPAMARAAGVSPLRVAYLYFPHGTNAGVNPWKAATAGTGFSFPSGLADSLLVNYKQDVLLLGGLFNQWGAYGYSGDVNNDHASASSAFLTGARANWKAPGVNFTLSSGNASESLPAYTGMKSVDVMIADKIAADTAIPVLHLTPPGFAAFDGGTANYSVDYRTYLSWKSSTSPTPRYEKPSAAFTALFGSGTPAPTPTPGPSATPSPGPDMNARKRSILDLALGDVNSLKTKLGPLDNIKLDEYLSSLRDVEKTIQTSNPTPTPGPTPNGPACVPGTKPADGMAFDAMTKAYLDLIVLAFQCDRTRVASYMMDYELSTRSYAFAGANKYDCHSASHGGFAGDYGDAKKIGTWYANQFAYLISKMKSVSDVNGTLLSQSILHLGSGTNTTEGDHPDSDLPMVIAGQGGGLLATGRALNANNTRMSNYHLSLLQKIGVNVTTFASSNGTISGL